MQPGSSSTSILCTSSTGLPRSPPPPPPELQQLLPVVPRCQRPTECIPAVQGTLQQPGALRVPAAGCLAQAGQGSAGQQQVRDEEAKVVRDGPIRCKFPVCSQEVGAAIAVGAGVVADSVGCARHVACICGTALKQKAHAEAWCCAAGATSQQLPPMQKKSVLDTMMFPL
jgi:hypothetical protein